MKRKQHKGRMVLSLAVTVALVIGVVLGAGIVSASPGMIDLTSPGASVAVTGATGGVAIFEVFTPTDPTGSGVFDPFVRISTNKPVEKGYNTSYRPLQFDENNAPGFTRDFLVTNVPMVERDGELYREFQLDINQNKSDPSWYLSLDKFQLWLTNTANLHGYDYGSLSFPIDAIKIWELSSDDWFKLDYRLNEGSGKRDLRVLVPDELFAGYTYVILFSEFGNHYPNNDGYEEWGVAIYPATKAGYKFHDLNANGVWDKPDEPGLEGWTINLSGTSAEGQAVSMSTTTDSTGYYKFSVPAGTYTVTETIPADWFQSKPGTPSAPAGYNITLGNGALDLDNDFGNFQRAKKSGYKFHDQNYNGVWDKPDEPGLEGWTIKLDGTDGMDNAVNLTTTTGSDGSYSFTVNPGSYTVSEVLKDTTWFQSYPAAPGTWVVTLKSGDDDKDNDFGNYQQAKKSGYKFNDLNANGVWDKPDEPGLEGWTIKLDGTDGMGNTVNLTTTTGSDGSYSFTVDPGSYTVSEVLKDATWFQSYPAAPGTWAATLKSGDDDKDNDFGNYQQAKKSGYKFNDLNANGVWDKPDEPGLGGWTIKLDGTDGMGNAVNLTTTTGSDGSYSFTVNPGSYTVSEVLKDTTWFQSYPAAPGTWVVTLKSGDDDKDNDFGNYQQAKKSGYKFNDLNANGVWDKPDEPGLEGWTIKLDGTDGMGNTVNLTTTTGSDGSYSFTVDPGSYTVSEVLKDATWFQSYPAAPGTWVVTLKSGDDDKDNDFGNYQQADLSIDKTGKITYTIVVSNDGPSPALNVVVDDDLPGNLAWTIPSPPAVGTWEITGTTVKHLHGVIASLASGASVTVTVEADIDGDWDNSPLPNTATTSSTTPDPDTTDNSDDADIRPF